MVNPIKAKYGRETDSEQVPRGKDEKNFEKRVKKCLKLLRGKGLEVACAPRLMLALTGVLYVLGAGQHRLVEREKSGR